MKTASVLILSAVLALALVLPAAAADPYFVRGEMNTWDTSAQMNDMGGGHYQLTVTGMTANQMYEYKLANADWSEQWPGSNGKIMADGAGEATFHLYVGVAADGWEPNPDRVGYAAGAHGWDIMGSFNAWAGPVMVLADQGGGLFMGTTTVATAGAYEFKIRKDGDWAISIGGDFGNAAGNIQVTTINDGDQVKVELDLTNGRHRVTVLPATVAVEESSWGHIKSLFD